MNLLMIEPVSSHGRQYFINMNCKFAQGRSPFSVLKDSRGTFSHFSGWKLHALNCGLTTKYDDAHMDWRAYDYQGNLKGAFGSVSGWINLAY